MSLTALLALRFNTVSINCSSHRERDALAEHEHRQAFSGALISDPGSPDSSAVSVVVQAASGRSGNALRDKHLRSDDFLDVERFPTMAFESHKVERASNDSLLVQGYLTIHGVTKRVILPVRIRHNVRRDESGVDYGVRVLQLNVNTHPNNADALVLWARGQLVANNRPEALVAFERAL